MCGLVVARIGEILPVLEREIDLAFGITQFSGGGSSRSPASERPSLLKEEAGDT